jgi:hypothetical protein
MSEREPLFAEPKRSRRADVLATPLTMQEQDNQILRGLLGLRPGVNEMPYLWLF